MVDPDLLQNVLRYESRLVARCPACAEEGNDKTGNHLIVFSSGAYGCVANPGNKEHSRRIWQLAGKREKIRLNVF